MAKRTRNKPIQKLVAYLDEHRVDIADSHRQDHRHHLRQGFYFQGLVSAALIVLAFSAGAPVVAEPLPASQRFQFELWAQNHCPTDAVVWVDGSSQFYNSSEERWYGRTTNGVFVCKHDAENAGYRLKPQR
jgi:hypothetical protein